MTFSLIGQSQNTGDDLFMVKDEMPEYKAGEVLVKFKDDANVTLLKSAGTVKTGLARVDAMAKKWSFKEMEQVFKGTKMLKSAQFITLPDGTQRQLSQLFNIYKITFFEGVDAKEVVQELSQLEDVDYAELNGTAKIVGGIPVSEPFDLPPVNKTKSVATSFKSLVPVIPNDPYFSQQWYLPEVKADSLWGLTTGDSVQVIGILDTGVDWLHPDLKNKIWENKDEIPDNGIDDDSNGYIDDIRGWDFVNQDNNPKDDNSHGTHCAGIAGAETNNGIGISGVSWGARIMPIKVFQSNGVGYFSHIASGFWYAAKNGCTVFSNSWMSTGESMTIRLAMEYAYSKGLIVASAGNMNTKTDMPCPPWPPYEPNYPACYNWVLGVEATVPGGGNASFSNFDPTGPVISDGRPYGSIFFNNNDYNYEMRAPGVSFISTVPNGQYRAYSGTSMACPLVAGSIALMKSYDPDLSNEQVFAKLIQPIKINKLQAGVLDILKCTLTNPPPDLYFVKYNFIDSLYAGNDKDGRADAGETIDMKITVKNAGGFGDSIYAILKFTEFEDRSVAKILKDTCFLGNISAYAKQTSFDAFKIEIDSKVVDMRIISFQLLVYQKGTTDTLYQNLAITVEHGIEIKGTYKKLHLYPNAYYIVTEVAVIDSLILEPGAVLTFHSSMFMAINSYIKAVGTPDSLITFTATTEGYSWRGIIMGSNAKSLFDYCIFEYGTTGYGDQLITAPDTIRNSIFRFNTGGITSLKATSVFEKNLITNQTGDIIGGIVSLPSFGTLFRYNLFAENSGLNELNRWAVGIGGADTLSTLQNNVFINNKPFNLGFGHPGLSFNYLPKNYFGTINIKEIYSTFQEFYKEPSSPVIILNGILESPPEQCHGVVWKVEINEQNPQDVPITIGNGPAKFKVYFNRSMDPEYQPFLTFGVRFPFTQNAVEDSASWSEDHKTWTAYKTFTKSTGDGENTIRIAYAKDLEHFEIPIERSRFKFVVQAASSQSVEFMATPGIGKVYLEWPDAETDEVLGYNLYRIDVNSENKDSLKLNNELITDTLFTDFEVTPDSTYYYAFSMVNTDFSESDFSKIVFAKVLSAANGDANGDFSVNVLDVTTIVAFLLNQNPQPFIFEAADVNGDGQINVLDIVATVNKVLNPGKSGSLAETGTVNLYLQNDTLFADASVPVGAIQFDITNVSGMEEIEKLKALQGFESGFSVKDNTMRLIVYSLTGKTIAVGNSIPLLRLKKGIGITNMIMGDKTGSPLTVNYLSTGLWNLRELGAGVASLGQNYPNPFNKTTTIPVMVNEPLDKLVVRIINIAGQEVAVLPLKNPIVGENLLHWNTNGQKGMLVYRLEISRGGKMAVVGVKKMIVNQ